LVLAIPLAIYLLDLSLSGEEGFEAARQMLGSLPAKFFIFLLCWGLLHHLFAGIRYLALDLDLGVDKPRERMTAWMVMLGAPLAALVLSAVLWS
jgi:succinate dehydrogenase / fumarate reductase cytochrome b subunit